ncbi:MAG: hypothetical protein RLZZ427_871 [Pseudomonadota bacterium]
MDRGIDMCSGNAGTKLVKRPEACGQFLQHGKLGHGVAILLRCFGRLRRSSLFRYLGLLRDLGLFRFSALLDWSELL